MLDINDLEKRWLHYKIKSYLPYAIILLSLIIIISIISIFAFTHDKNNKKVVTKKIIQIPTSTLKSTPVIKKKIFINKVEKTTQTTMKLEPSLGFIHKMQNATQPYYTKVQSTYIERKKIPKKEVKVATIPKEEVSVPKKIKIKRRNTKNDITKIIQRFKKNNNPALSLFVAKKYYELGDYHQSYNYALITNNINSDIEQSWIIFAKSLVKLHKKNKAIKILSSYIKVSHSNVAQILLEEIISGEFQ